MSYFKIKRDSNTPVELGVLVENVEGLDERLALKVDKAEGKGLSTNDYTTTEKNNVASNTAARHSHGNKSVIDKITQALLDNWNAAFSHISDAVKHITASERTLWNTVSSKANKSDVLTKTNTTEYTPTSDYYDTGESGSGYDKTFVSSDLFTINTANGNYYLILEVDSGATHLGKNATIEMNGCYLI